MAETKKMSDLVDRLFQGTLEQKTLIFWKPVERLMEPFERDHSHPGRRIRLSEDN